MSPDPTDTSQPGDSPPAELSAALEQKEPTFWAQHGQKLVALFFWASLLGGYGWYMLQHNLSPVGAVQQLIDLLGNSVYGPLLFIVVYTLRPLIFFSATLLTVAGGYLFGPVGGIVYTIIGSNISALLAYLIGRYFGQGLLDTERAANLVEKYAARLRDNSFETVLIMRFIFLPYDLVNYLAGFLRINWKAFVLASALGAIPGTVSFSLFGASIQGDFSVGTLQLNPWALAGAVIIFIVSLGLSRYFKQREKKREANASTHPNDRFVPSGHS